MEKTQEQNDSRLHEIIKNFIEQLKGEYQDFSAVVSANDGEGTACVVYGTILNLMENVDCIEANEAYKKAKKTNELFDQTTED